MRLALATVALACMLGAMARAGGAEVSYPEGYRGWRHVKSMLIQPGHALYGSFGGLHHLYANAPALEGYASGHFPDGSVIVFDLLEAVAADAAVTEGPRKVLGVMQKDAKRFAATGGWGFEGFAGGDPAQRAVAANAKTACFDCHASQQAHDYVFSRARD